MSYIGIERDKAEADYGVDLSLFGSSFNPVLIEQSYADHLNWCNEVARNVTVLPGKRFFAEVLELSDHVGHSNKLSYKRTVGDPAWVQYMSDTYPNFIGYQYDGQGQVNIFFEPLSVTFAVDGGLGRTFVGVV